MSEVNEKKEDSPEIPANKENVDADIDESKEKMKDVVSKKEILEKHNANQINFDKVKKNVLEKAHKEYAQKHEYNFIAHRKKYRFAKRSFFVFNETNWLRKKLVWLITSVWFDRVVTLVILLNSVLLALYDYSDRLSPNNTFKINTIISSSEIPFTTFFFFEFLFKAIAMGFVIGKGTYLRHVWNIIDFIVVITALISLLPNMPNLSSIRTFRVVRPLKSINTIKGVKILLNSLFKALPALSNVIIFLVFILALYGTLGIQLFSGLLENRCRTTPKPVNGVWIAYDNITHLCGSTPCEIGYCGNPSEYGIPKNRSEMDNVIFDYGFANYDNIINATITVFISITGQGWSQFFYLLWNATTPIIPILYYGTLILYGTFFLINLILAVISDSFNDHKNHKRIDKNRERFLAQNEGKAVKGSHDTRVVTSSSDGSSDDESDQSSSAETENKERASRSGSKDSRQSKLITIDIANKSIKKTTEKRSPHDMIPTNPIRKFCYKITSRPDIQLFNSVLIIMNTLLLCFDQYPENDQLSSVIELTNSVLTFYFVIEMIAKIVGLGIKSYMRDSFNIFDSIIAIISVAEFIMEHTVQTLSTRKILSAFRGARLLRIFKLVRSWKTLRNLLRTMGRTIIDMKDFSLLMLIFMIVFSLMGRELYAYEVRFDSAGHPTKDLVNGKSGRLNFDTFPNSLVLIFVMFTNDQWNFIMYDHIRTNDGVVAVIFFFVLEIVGNFILFRLFLAILINNFSLSSQQVRDDSDELDPLEIYLKQLREKARRLLRFGKKPALSITGDVNDIEMKKRQQLENKTRDGTSKENKGPDTAAFKFSNQSFMPHRNSLGKRASVFLKPFGKQEPPKSRFQKRGNVMGTDSLVSQFQAQMNIPSAEENSQNKDENLEESGTQFEVLRRPSFITTIAGPTGEVENKPPHAQDAGFVIKSEDISLRTEDEMTTEEEETYIKYLEEMEQQQKKEGILARFKNSKKKKAQLTGKPAFC